MNNTLLTLANNNIIHIFGGILVIFLAGITAFLANRKIAVYNDGVRPLVGQHIQGNLKYKALAGMSFAMSIGYVIGFIPFSLASKILIMHTILLGSEMIGLVAKNDKKWWTLAATIVAMVYGGAIYWGLEGLSIAINKTTYKGFGFDLGMIVDGAFPFIFAMFPAVSTFIQSGWKKGLITIIFSIVTYILISLFGWNQAHLYPMAMTLLVGCALLLGFAIHEHIKSKQIDIASDTQKSNSGIKEKFKLFQENSEKIIANKWYFVISGAIASMVITCFASSPLVSMALQTNTEKAGDVVSALIADTTWVIGFLPLVILTALLTGVYSPVGLTAVFVWGDIAKIIGAQIVTSTGNQNTYFIAIGIAGFFGGISLFLETYLLKYVALLLMKVPRIQRVSDAMRTGITKTINYAFLFGGIVAAFIMGQHVAAAISKTSEIMAGLAVWLPSLGAGIVILILIINQISSKRKIAEIAVGPLGAIIVGILFNIIYFIGT